MTSPAADRPQLQMQAGRHKRIRNGHPWGYSNEIVMTPAVKALPGGTLVTLRASDGEGLGTFFFNPHVLICLRQLTREMDADIDEAFLAERFAAALKLRERLFDRPFYRLVHAESDALPGLIVDRFGDVLVVQANTAGMDRLMPEITAALLSLLSPRAIVARNDSAARQTEGLEGEVRLVHGSLEGGISLEENGCTFFCDPLGGQKTGWFYDHRPNRAFVAKLAKGASVLDLYCYGGAFSMPVAKAGARRVVSMDRSAGAIELVRRAAEANGVADIVEAREAEVFRALEEMGGRGEKFDIVIADPPAFIKSRKDLAAGLRGYRKLARLAAQRVAPGGILLMASCSHNAEPAAFALEVARGVAEAGRTGRILHVGGAGPDHPVHPFLAESEYLKCRVMQLD